MSVDVSVSRAEKFVQEVLDGSYKWLQEPSWHKGAWMTCAGERVTEETIRELVRIWVLEQHQKAWEQLTITDDPLHAQAEERLAYHMLSSRSMVSIAMQARLFAKVKP